MRMRMIRWQSTNQSILFMRIVLQLLSLMLADTHTLIPRNCLFDISFPSSNLNNRVYRTQSNTHDIFPGKKCSKIEFNVSIDININTLLLIYSKKKTSKLLQKQINLPHILHAMPIICLPKLNSIWNGRTDCWWLRNVLNNTIYVLISQ